MPNSDVLIIIALKEEFASITPLLSTAMEPRQLDDQTPYYHLTLPTSSETPIRADVIYIGEIGNEESRSVTAALIKQLQPKLVVNIGIAGALDDQLKLGDVVVAREVDNYIHRGKVKQKDIHRALTFEDVQFGGQSRPTTPIWVINLDNLVYSSRSIWHRLEIERYEDYVDTFPEEHRKLLQEKGIVQPTPQLMVGPFASGPFVAASKEFKLKLQERNRNFIAIEMESYGVLDAVHHERDVKPETIIIKGISDFGDERKKEMDNVNSGAIRAWAARNAFRLLLRFLSMLNFRVSPITIKRDRMSGVNDVQSLTEELHAIVISEYLKDPYDKPSCVARVTFDTYSALFRTIVTCPDIEANTNIFEQLYLHFEKHRAILYAEGRAGTGKTSFLSVLYWYLLKKREQNVKAPIPFFINYHRFNHLRAAAEVASTLELQLQILTQIACIDKNQEIWIILDGADDYARHKDEIWKALNVVVRENARIHVIGMRPNANEPSQSDLLFRFNPISVNDNNVTTFASKFVAISRFEGKEAHLTNECERLQLDEVDLFMASLILQYSDHTNYGGLAGLLQKYCVDTLKALGDGELFSRATELAFRTLIAKDATLIIDDERDSVVYDLIDRHANIGDFLVAHYIFENIRSTGATPEKANADLELVYPYRINKLTKSLINRNGNILREVLNGIKKILNSGASHTAKANACYLAGRVDLNQLQNQSRLILEEFRIRFDREKSPPENSTEERRYLLLARTLYISLSYLGAQSAQTDYIACLLKNPRWDEFNRGFHLEYYGDVDYDPSMPLLSIDNLDECPRTFSQLKIRINRRTKSPLLQIELYTLVSLAQHRHAAGKLDATARTDVVDVIQGALDAHSTTLFDGLREYVSMVHGHLKLEVFSNVDPFHQLYQLKITKRSGWVSRGIEECESVCDHTIGAYLMGLYFLPDKWTDSQKSNDRTYSKEKILKMLLIHDLAESVTGDLLPGQTDEEKKRVERAIYRQVGMLGTYADVGALASVDELWNEFEHRDTINSMLAKEIDRLELLVQLLIYHQQYEAEIHDFKTWRSDLIKEIRTDLGRRILHQLLDFYEGRQARTGTIFTW